MNNRKFKIFATCLLVKGANRSLICDIQRSEFHFIPESLYVILLKFEGKTIFSIKSYFKNKYDEYIDEYFNFLLEKDLVFFTNSPSNFPKLDLFWDEPTLITNAIIDVNDNSKIDFQSTFTQLNELGCRNLQIRSFGVKELNYFDVLLEKLLNNRICTVELTIKFDYSISENELYNFIEKHSRVSIITIFNSPNEKTFHFKPNAFGYVFFIKDDILSESHCGIVSHNLFTINIKTFTEAQKHNTCLNRKISIDTEGYIRNCPSMKEHYGNIKDTTLQQALEHPDFKKYWFINKDQVAVCKDCEFRYICTDCRAYIENPEDMYSKPLKCGYNPYTCEWEEWSTNPLKQKAIDHYGMREMVEAKE